jgi:hypothetical protein
MRGQGNGSGKGMGGQGNGSGKGMKSLTKRIDGSRQNALRCNSTSIHPPSFCFTLPEGSLYYISPLGKKILDPGPKAFQALDRS